jgi:hypothetical protein
VTKNGWSADPGRYCFLPVQDIERELEETLHRVLDPIAARPVPARRAAPSQSRWATVVGGAGAALSLKVLAGAAVAAATVTAAGAVTTGSLNPAVWEREASQSMTSLTGHHGTPTAEAAPDQAGTNNSKAPAKSQGNTSTNGNGQADTGSGETSNNPKSTAGPTGEPIDPSGMHPPVRVTPAP